MVDAGESQVTFKMEHLSISFAIESNVVRLEFERNKYIHQLPSYYTSQNQCRLIRRSLGEGQVIYSHLLIYIFRRPFVKRFALCHRTVVLSCLY